MNQFLLYNHNIHSNLIGIKLTDFYSLYVTNFVKIINESCTIFIIGDHIGDPNTINFDCDQTIKSLKGNFYLILVHNKQIKIIGTVG